MRSKFAHTLAFGLFSFLLCVTIGFATQQWSPINFSLEPAARAALPSSSLANLKDKTSRAGLIESYGRLPLRFEANRGQTGARVKFISRGAGYSLFLTGDEAVLRLRGTTSDASAAEGDKLANVRHSTLRMKLVNANPASRVTGLDEAAGKSNYFIGNDPGAWRTNVASYSRVKYESVYPGVDLVWHGAQRQLEYDFVLAPGARPERIKLAIEGADGVEIDREGALVLRVDGRSARMLKPAAWQQVDGERREIACQYRLDAQRRIAFDIGEYDSSKQLVIDPVLVYSTFIGGGGFDQSLDIAVDGEGAAYITGRTDSTDFPGPSQIQANKAAQLDAFVLKLNPAGNAVVYATWLGGGANDFGLKIAVDSSGAAYVSGTTASADFPLKDAIQQTRKGAGDAFVAKLNAAGSALVYSTLLGGSGDEGVGGLAVDGGGNAFVAGTTDSTDFPLAGAFQNARRGSGAYSSGNAGDSWSAIGNGLQSFDVNDLVVDANNPMTIYAATERGVFKTTDGGASWNRLGGEQFLNSVTQLIVDPVNPANLYAVSFGSLYKSVDSGATWARKSFSNIRVLAIDPAAPATLYAAAINGFYKSSDGGETFMPRAMPPIGGGSVIRVDAVAVDPVAPMTVYTATDPGIYRSTDGGATFTYISAGLFTSGQRYQYNQLLISRSNPLVMFALIRFGGILKSVNGGRDWTRVDFPATGVFVQPQSLAIDPNDANIVYVGTLGFGVYKSVNGGATWQQRNSGLNNRDVRSVAIDRTAPSKIYVGADSGRDAYITKINATGSALVYSSYLGGSDVESSADVGVDAAGNAYVAGYTSSPDFPVGAAYQSSLKGQTDAYIAKINAAGSAVVWATYLGGSNSESALSVAVNAAGNAFIAGATNSTDFPVRNAAQPAYQATTQNSSDAFITRFSADGSQLDYSTYLGGSGSDFAWAIAIDTAGAAYVTGNTISNDFPTVAAPQPKRGGDPQFFSTDAFVTKLSADGSSFAYSTYLGGGSSDEGYGIAVDAAGAAYVTGVAGSEDFPTTPGALRRTWARDSFITKVGINADLALSLGDLPDPVMVNNQLVYTLTVTNNGPDPAANVAVADTLPSGVVFVSANTTQGTCSGSSSINCDLGSLNAGARATITITVRPNAAGTITNRASVTSATADANPANNSATQETRVTTTPSIFGRVTTSDGAGTPQVTVKLTGAQKPDATSGPDGSYQFGELLTGANYTVTPSRSGYVFNPPNRAFNNLTTDQRGDFAAVPCVFTITPRALSFPATGGSGSATITSPDPQCQWTVRSNSDWIRITSAASGSGAGVVTFTVAPTVGSRSGSVTIAGSALSVNQEFNACAKSDFLVPRTFALKEVSARYRTPRFAVKDFNSDGRLDLVFLTESSTGSGTGVAFAAGNSSGGFDQQTQLFSSPGGESLGALTVNDFNGDGRLDLGATAGSGSGGKVLIAFGNNAGGFAAPASYTLTGGAFEIAAGDFNGDRRPDVATSSPSFGGISILLNKGAGEMEPARTVTLTQFNGFSALAASDFNGDGKDDLVVIDAYQRLATMISDGTGAFGAPSLQTIPNNAEFVMAGDFTGDRKNDVAVAASNIVSLRAGNGDGTFGAPVDYTFSRAVHIAIAEDLNGDGRLDLAATNVDGVTIRFGEGQGRFGDPITYLNGTIHNGSFNKTSIAVADFNRDGWLDLFSLGLIGSAESQTTATSGSVGLSLLPGVGNGRFAGSRGFNFIDPQVNYYAPELAAGDLNGDGAPDLAIAHGSDSVTVMLNNSLGELIQSRRYLVGTVPRRVKLADFNRDGKLDIIVLNLNSSSATLLVNNGKGEFQLAVQIAAGQNPRALGVGDFNNDGKPDLITRSATSGLMLLAGDGNLSFTQIADGLAADIQNAAVTTGDFNGDGNLDFAVINPNPDSIAQDCSLSGDQFAFYAGDGRGAFRLSASLTLSQKPKALLAADINGDGRDDVVFASNCYSSEGLYAMLANSDGGFAQPVKYAVGPDAINPLSATLGDFNGDGKPDAAVANVNSGNVSILQGKGDGSFDAPILLPVAAITSYLAAADFNGDGATDLAVSRGESDSIGVLPNRASCAPPGAAVNASAASYFSYKLANESIAALFGANVASTTQAATSLPLPTTLANTSVKVKDAVGVERLSPLFFVSPNQINHLIPAGTAPGVALVTVMNGSNVAASGTTLITATSPGLFTADASGQGIASAVVLRVKADGSQVFEPIVRFDSAQNRFVAIPIDLSNASEQVFLLLFGTGIRNHSALSAVNARIGGENAEVLFAGAQGGFAGLDQINLRLPRALAGRGDVEVRLMVNGRAANGAGINVK